MCFVLCLLFSVYKALLFFFVFFIAVSVCLLFLYVWGGVFCVCLFSSVSACFLFGCFGGMCVRFCLTFLFAYAGFFLSVLKGKVFSFCCCLFIYLLAGILNPSALGGSGGMRPGRTSCNHPNPLRSVVLLLFIVVSLFAGFGCCVVAVYVCHVLCFCCSYMTVLVCVCLFFLLCFVYFL